MFPAGIGARGGSRRHRSGVAKSEKRNRSPGLGERARDFTLKDLDGRAVHLAELYPLAPLVLIFFRGAASAECVEQLREYKRRNVGLYESGALIHAICSDDHKTARAMVDQEKLPFRVLLDEKGKVAKEWGVDSLTATFVIDKSGSVRFAAIDEGDARTPAARVLEFMRGQTAGQAAS